MAKAYIHSFTKKREGDDWRERIRFASRVENAARWSSADAAEIDLADFKWGVTISSVEGETRVIRDLHLEELPSGGFAIWCDLPFTGV